MSLDLLVDHLANDEFVNREYQQKFNRDLRQKILYVVGNELMILGKVNPSRCTSYEIQAYFRHLQSKHGANTKILSEMPWEQAFALWKKLAIKVPTKH